jgi:hypothetical protein
MADSNIGLAGLNRYLKAFLTLAFTSSQTCKAIANNPAKSGVTVLTAHPFYLFAVYVCCFEPKLEMSAKNLFSFTNPDFSAIIRFLYQLQATVRYENSKIVLLYF